MSSPRQTLVMEQIGPTILLIFWLCGNRFFPLRGENEPSNINSALYTYISDCSFMRDDVMVFRGKIEDANRQLLEISKVYHTNISAYHKVQGDLQEAEELRQMEENTLLALLSASEHSSGSFNLSLMF